MELLNFLKWEQDMQQLNNKTNSRMALLSFVSLFVCLSVAVRYVVMLLDGVIVAESPKEGVEFYLKDGHFCTTLPKAIKTMTREEKVDLIVQPQYAFGGGVTTLPNGCSPIPPNSVLRVDLELLSFKPVVDVTNDLKVVKKILKEGVGALTANEGASVIIRVSGKSKFRANLDLNGYKRWTNSKYCCIDFYFSRACCSNEEFSSRVVVRRRWIWASSQRCLEST